jgi:NAD dependent epimerase/dehydratase family enzyme
MESLLLGAEALKLGAGKLSASWVEAEDLVREVAFMRKVGFINS